MRLVTLRPDAIAEDILASKVEAYREAIQQHPTNARLHSGLICHLDGLRSTTVEQAQANRREWYAKHKLTRFDDWPNERVTNRRLRIGYVSPDFRRTSAAYAFGPVVMDHNRDRFEVTCYSVADKPDDELRNIFKANVDRWRIVEKDATDDLIRMVREDEIDILVDLVGHIAGNVLQAFTAKPAPVQVTAWGCLGGTGCPEVDYLLSDPIVTPAADREHYTETVVDLPCALAYMPVLGCPEVKPAPVERNGYVTFGFLGRLFKADDRTLQLWAEVLHQVPGSKLLLKSKRTGEPEIVKGLVHRFNELGITEERLDLRGQTLHLAHLDAHADVDIILDALPQNGGISALEAMWQGVPVVTLAGQGPHGRMGASIQNAIGLTSAQTEREYVLSALAYATDPDLLREIRGGMRNMVRRSWLCRRPVRDVEEAYRMMWERYARTSP